MEHLRLTLRFFSHETYVSLRLLFFILSRRIPLITRIVRTIVMLTQCTRRARRSAQECATEQIKASRVRRREGITGEGRGVANLRIVKARISLTASSREVREVVLVFNDLAAKEGELIVPRISSLASGSA